MRDYIVTIVVFIISSITLAFVNYLDFSPTVVQRIIITGITTIIIILNISWPSIANKIITDSNKRVIFFAVNILIQLIVITTGGPFSPFLMLIYLSTITISLFFEFLTVGIFLTFSFVNIALSVALNPIILARISEDPTVLFVIATSFIAIIPLIKLISDVYHMRGKLLQRLHNQLSLEESLLSDVEELIFITDINFSILSINNTVESTLLRSRSDLIYKNIFEVLLLKSPDGNLIGRDNFDVQKIIPTTYARTISNLSLLSSTNSMRKVSLQIKRFVSVEGKFDQLVFIVTPANKLQPNPTYRHINMEVASIKHKAFIEELKRKLYAQGLNDFASQLMFIDKSEQDILSYRTIEDHGITQSKVLIDPVHLCKLAIQNQQDFVKVLKVNLLLEDRIKDNQVSVFCNANYLQILLQKLLDVASLVASGEPIPEVKLSVGQNDTHVTLSIIMNHPAVLAEFKEDIFTQYYGRLSDKTNLKLGSGLEGFLAKTIADALRFDIKVIFFDGKVSFTLQIPK